MGEIKLIYILPFITVIAFFFSFNRRCSMESYLVFVLICLPLMNLKVTKEAWGGLRVFDIMCIYSSFFFFKKLTFGRPEFRYAISNLLFICLMAFILLGGLLSEFPSNSLMHLFKNIPIFIFARVLFIKCINDVDFHAKVVKILKFNLLLAFTFLLIQLSIGLEFTFYPVLNTNVLDSSDDSFRYPGFFQDAQTQGQFFAMGSFLFFNNKKDVSKRNIVINLFIFLASILGIVLSGSRSAFGGFCVGLFFCSILTTWKYRLFAVTLVIISFSAYAMFPKLPIFERVQSVGEDYRFRNAIWKEAFDFYNKNPYLGIGIGNYQNYVKRHAQEQYFVIDDELQYFDQPENGYLKILVEFGVFGFAIVIFFVARSLLIGLQFYFKKLVGQKVIFLIASVITWIIAFNTLYSLFDYRILIMVVTLLVLISAHPKTKKHVHENV